MKTFTATPADIDKKWILIDAEGIVLGRLATIVASILRGKNKPTFTPHMDMGDNVIVINADKVQMTGNKRKDKRYYWYTATRAASSSARLNRCWTGPTPSASWKRRSSA